MATNAERQAAYRQRHLAEGSGERVNIVIDVSTKRQLERLARHHGVTQRAVLEALLGEAERRTLDRMGVEAERAYLDGMA